jgi:hypothetical protein
MPVEEALIHNAASVLANMTHLAVVRGENAPVPFAAGGAGRVQLQTRLKLAPVVPTAALQREQAEQAEQPGLQPEQRGLQPEQPGLESAGQDARVEAPLLVRSFPAQREGVSGQPKLVRSQDVCASVLAEKLQIDTTTIADYEQQEKRECVVYWYSI